MKFNLQFVHFPKSPLAREAILNRMESCFDKFLMQVTSVKAFLCLEGTQHHLKIVLSSTHVKTCINATAANMSECIEKALQKLESVLRRKSAKIKHKMLSHGKEEGVRADKRNPFKLINIFDKYENAYASVFE